jgi:hypothetical protein
MSGAANRHAHRRYPVIAYVFASATVAQMEREDPSLAIAFHRMMVRIEAERLRFTSHELEALLP